MVEGLHAAIVALLGVVGTLVHLVRGRLDQLDDKLDRILDEMETGR